MFKKKKKNDLFTNRDWDQLLPKIIVPEFLVENLGRKGYKMMKLKKQAWEQAGPEWHEEAKIMVKDRLASEASAENARTITADQQCPNCVAMRVSALRVNPNLEWALNKCNLLFS